VLIYAQAQRAKDIRSKKIRATDIVCGVGRSVLEVSERGAGTGSLVQRPRTTLRLKPRHAALVGVLKA